MHSVGRLRTPYAPPSVDDLKDAGTEYPADRDDLEIWAQEQELVGRRPTEETLRLQRLMRHEEGL